MGPLEMFWGIVVLFFTIVSAIRGYNKELGVTVIILATLFLLLQFGPRVEQLWDNQLLDRLDLMPVDPETRELILALFYTGFFLAVVLASYAGVTFEYKGRPPPGMLGLILNICIGMINGWLVAGSLWYWLDAYEYPIVRPLLQLPLTSFAQEALLPLLPPNVLQPPVLIMAFVAVLLILRVRG